MNCPQCQRALTVTPSNCPHCGATLAPPLNSTPSVTRRVSLTGEIIETPVSALPQNTMQPFIECGDGKWRLDCSKVSLARPDASSIQEFQRVLSDLFHRPIPGLE